MFFPLVMYNAAFFISEILSDHVFFNLSNVGLLFLCFMLLLTRKEISKSAFIGLISLVLLMLVTIFNLDIYISLQTHIAVTLNVIICFFAACLLPRKFDVKSAHIVAAKYLFFGMVTAFIILSLVGNVEQGSRFYIHRSFVFIHLLIAYVLAYVLPLGSRSMLGEILLIAYAAFSGTQTGLLTSAIFFGALSLGANDARKNRSRLYFLVGLLFFVVPMFLWLQLDVRDMLGKTTGMLAYFSGGEVSSIGSGYARGHALSEGWRLLLENPIAGIGADNSKYHWTRLISHSQAAGPPGTHLHNSFLEVLVSYGLPAGAIFIAFIYRRVRQALGANSDQIFMVKVFIVCLLIFSMTNTIYKDPNLLFFFFFFITRAPAFFESQSFKLGRLSTAR